MSSACGYPLRLEPRFVERVWGSEDISFLYPSRPQQPRRVGEVWLTGSDNPIANGPWSGTSLEALARNCASSLLGQVPPHPSGQPVFPLLIKFLFTTDKLSVQVHPPDSRAAQEKSWGKSEMWHVLHAEPGARLAVGFRKNHSLLSQPGQLRSAVAGGAIEQELDWTSVKVGDTFFVPAGTVHAIGGGLVICEIQQNSDITYRLYDYNRPGADGRPRALHIEQALGVIQSHPNAGRTKPLPLAADEGSRLCLASSSYFITERWQFQKPFDHSAGARPEIWIALEGQAEFDAAGQRVRCAKGEVVILPADLLSVSIQPHSPCLFLRTYPPAAA
jgi:mannose-6-phosphate isomerase